VRATPSRPDNKITDVAALAPVTSLDVLSLHGNQIVDLHCVRAAKEMIDEL